MTHHHPSFFLLLWVPSTTCIPAPSRRASVNPLRCRLRQRSGFTLVELAMTALLLSMGLLTIFALLRRGIASRMEMEEEVRAASFADSAFNTLRAISDSAASSTNVQEWVEFWDAFQFGTTNLPLFQSATTELTDSPSILTGALYGNGEIYVFTNVNSSTRIAYLCAAEMAAMYEGYPTNRAQVTLHVWPAGSTNSSPQTYFTLFSNAGNLLSAGEESQKK